MDEMTPLDDEDIDDQIEQMIIENGMLLHSVVTLLVQKGILKQEEVDAEMEKLYAAMEDFGDDESDS